YMECGGKRSATPLWNQRAGPNQQKRRRRVALSAQSKWWHILDAPCGDRTGIAHLDDRHAPGRVYGFLTELRSNLIRSRHTFRRNFYVNDRPDDAVYFV